MDTLDIKIIRELTQGQTYSPFTSDVRISFRALARNLKVNEGTIRNRVKKLQRSSLQGLRILVNPSLLGLRVTQGWVDVRPPATKDHVTSTLRLIQGVVAIINHVGNSVFVVLFHESERSLKKLAELTTKVSNANRPVWMDVAFPRCGIELSRTDWEILGKLESNPRLPFKEVASELGVSSKTIKRRMRRMFEGRALFVLPSFNPRALEGAIVADLLVRYTRADTGSQTTKEIATHLDDCLARAERGKGYSLFNLIITNIARAEEILNWVKTIPGVIDARIDLVQERIESYDFLSQQLEAS